MDHDENDDFIPINLSGKPNSSCSQENLCRICKTNTREDVFRPCHCACVHRSCFERKRRNDPDMSSFVRCFYCQHEYQVIPRTGILSRSWRKKQICLLFAGHLVVGIAIIQAILFGTAWAIVHAFHLDRGLPSAEPGINDVGPSHFSYFDRHPFGFAYLWSLLGWTFVAGFVGIFMRGGRSTPSDGCCITYPSNGIIDCYPCVDVTSGGCCCNGDHAHAAAGGAIVDPDGIGLQFVHHHAGCCDASSASCDCSNALDGNACGNHSNCGDCGNSANDCLAGILVLILAVVFFILFWQLLLGLVMFVVVVQAAFVRRIQKLERNILCDDYIVQEFQREEGPSSKCMQMLDVDITERESSTASCTSRNGSIPASHALFYQSSMRRL